MLSSTQQLLKIAQEQLFKGASSQGETRGQMCEPSKRQISLKQSPLFTSSCRLFDLHEARSHAERLRDECTTRPCPSELLSHFLHVRTGA